MELPGVSDEVNNAQLSTKGGMQGSHRKSSAWTGWAHLTLSILFHSDLSETEVRLLT